MSKSTKAQLITALKEFRTKSINTTTTATTPTMTAAAATTTTTTTAKQTPPQTPSKLPEQQSNKVSTTTPATPTTPLTTTTSTTTVTANVTEELIENSTVAQVRIVRFCVNKHCSNVSFFSSFVEVERVVHGKQHYVSVEIDKTWFELMQFQQLLRFSFPDSSSFLLICRIARETAHDCQAVDQHRV